MSFSSHTVCETSTFSFAQCQQGPYNCWKVKVQAYFSSNETNLKPAVFFHSMGISNSVLLFSNHFIAFFFAQNKHKPIKDKKAFQSKINHPLGNRSAGGSQVNKFEQVWGHGSESGPQVKKWGNPPPHGRKTDTTENITFPDYIASSNH